MLSSCPPGKEGNCKCLECVEGFVVELAPIVGFFKDAKLVFFQLVARCVIIVVFFIVCCSRVGVVIAILVGVGVVVRLIVCEESASKRWPRTGLPVLSLDPSAGRMRLRVVHVPVLVKMSLGDHVELVVVPR